MRQRKPGAPKGNQNAGGSGLYTPHPTVVARLEDERRVADLHPGDLTTGLLGPLAQDMADGAAWLAEGLAALPGVDAARLAGLFAAVAHECYQVAAELAGVTGIKPAPLGQLNASDFDALLRNQIRTLALILGQVATAVKRIRDREEIAQNGLMDNEGDLNPVLSYLAAHMRAAKRMLRDMGANVRWGSGIEAEEDLAETLNREILSAGTRE